MTVLDVADLRVRYAPDVHAVRGAGFSVAAGETLGVVGESGSGKTALALAVLGLLPDSARADGSVRLHGEELLGRSDAELSRIRGNELAMVFQDPMSALNPFHTIGDQIAETIRIHKRAGRAAARAQAVELLDLVGIPGADKRARAHPHELSGGMRRRALIAMAIANGPSVLIADEPTASLDVTVQAQVLDVLRTAGRAVGAAIVLIAHDLGVVAGVADRVMVMYAGRTVEQGPVDEIYRHPRNPYTIGLLRSAPRIGGARPTPIAAAPPAATGCPFRTRCPIPLPACGNAEPEPVTVGPDHIVACGNTAATRDPSAVFPPLEARPARPLRRERPVLEVDGLVRHHPGRRRRAGTVRAVDGITFDVWRGETLALVGESGSGKTTALMEILRLDRPQQGRVTVLGEDTATLRRARRRELRRNVQMVFQDPSASLNPRLRIRTTVAEPLTAHGLPARERVRELLALVGLEPAHADRYPHELSGGQGQRVAIARALALEPSLLLLDEPVAALDVSVQAGVLTLLEELQTRLGLAYVFVAHDLAVVHHIADRVAVMHMGRIVEFGTVDDVFETPAHPYTRALLDAVPIPDPLLQRARPLAVLQGDPADPFNPPEGCRFRPRCPRYRTLGPTDRDACDETDPRSRTLARPAHQVACHHPRSNPGDEP